MNRDIARWMRMVCGGVLLGAGCGSSQVDQQIGEHWVFWSADALRIETLDGMVVYDSVAETSPFGLRIVEESHDYGSGSFTFLETEKANCGQPAWRAPSGGDELVIEGSYSGCEADIVVSFRSDEEHWLTMNIATSGEGNRMRFIGDSAPGQVLTGFGAQYSGTQFNGTELPIWCQEQGHGRGAEPVTELLSTAPGNPAGDWHTSYTCVPWMIQDSESGLLVENTERVVFDMSSEDRFRVNATTDSFSLSWVSASDLPELLSRYTAETGRMTAFPQWSQEGVIVRAHGGADAIEETVAEAEAAGLPLAALWIEDWCGQRSTALGTRMLWNWDVDRNKYPDWEEMVARLKARGIRVLAYINPYLVDASDREDVSRHLFAEAVAGDYLVKQPDGELFWMDQAGFEAAVVDLTNPQARDWLQSVLEDLIDTGVSGWMADFSEGLPLDVVLHEGVAATAHNQWPERWAAINRSALESKGVWEDSVVFHRSGNARSPAVARSFWLGDQLTSWDAYDGLASVVPAFLTSGLSGYTMQHSDTGGYLSVSALGVTRDRELFQRWVELNTFTPLLRMHSTNQPDANHQWNSDAETLAHLSKMASVFAALAPYRATVMADAEAKGWPAIRPLFFRFPDDTKSWMISDQFLLGDDLLLAPVVEQGATTRTLYLPPGRWVHGPTGAAYDGAQEITVEAPIGRPPVFVHEGAEVASTVTEAFLD